MAPILEKIFGSHLTWKPVGNFLALMKQSLRTDIDGSMITGKKNLYYMMVFMAPWVA